MGKTRTRIATAATIAALGGLGAVALESNPGIHATARTAAVTSGAGGRPIVTSSSGSTAASQPAVQSAGVSRTVTQRPIVTRTSGGLPPGQVERQDD